MHLQTHQNKHSSLLPTLYTPIFPVIFIPPVGWLIIRTMSRRPNVNTSYRTRQREVEGEWVTGRYAFARSTATNTMWSMVWGVGRDSKPEASCRMFRQVFLIQVLRIPGWRDFRYHSAFLQNTCSLSGFPALRIWMHSPSIHCSHSPLRQGVNATGIFIKLRISFFFMHHSISMIACFWCIL